MLELAKAGLKARARLDWANQDEAYHLFALEEVAAGGQTPAEEKLELFRGRWEGRVDPIFAEFAY
jgi:glutamate--cysteine ligase